VVLRNYHGDGMNFEMPRSIYFFNFYFNSHFGDFVILPCGDGYGVVN